MGDIALFANFGTNLLPEATNGISSYIGLDNSSLPVRAHPLVVNIKDYGAVGNGTTDDTAAINAAAALGPVFLPSGLYSFPSSNFGASLGPKKFFGQGQIKTGINSQAPFFSAINTEPARGNQDNPDAAFNGDISRIQFPVAQRITGVSTLGQPATGYLYTPEAYPYYTYLFNTSGWNESLNSNDGRTSAVANMVKITQAGQGDAMCFSGSVFVTGTRAGSTNFLANPAGSLLAGGVVGGANGVYLNPYETILTDGGFDVAALGLVCNFRRTNNTGAKSAMWGGVRFQSIGTVECDAMIAAAGKWKTGLDFSMSTLDFGTTKAAIALKADDRIYLNCTAVASGSLDANWRATTFSNNYISYNAATTRILLVASGTAAITLHGTSAIDVANGVNVGVGKNYAVAGTRVVSSRKTGWTMPTGTATRTTFDTATVTLPQLAERMKALLDDLDATAGHGLIGLT